MRYNFSSIKTSHVYKNIKNIITWYLKEWKKAKPLWKYLSCLATSLFCQAVITSFMKVTGLNTSQIKNIFKFKQRPMIQYPPFSQSVGMHKCLSYVPQMKRWDVLVYFHMHLKKSYYLIALWLHRWVGFNDIWFCLQTVSHSFFSGGTDCLIIPWVSAFFCPSIHPSAQLEVLGKQDQTPAPPHVKSLTL